MVERGMIDMRAGEEGDHLEGFTENLERKALANVILRNRKICTISSESTPFRPL
jgi:hypothetical protein